MRSRIGRLAALALAAHAAAAMAAGSRQAAYDAAQAAYDRQDWAAAASGFAPLLPADASRPLGRSEAVIAVRLADAELRLGHTERAAALAQRGLRGLPEDEAVTLTQAWLVVADAARFTLAYDDAGRAYAKALAYADRSAVIDLRVLAAGGNAMALATLDPAAAAGPLDAVLSDKASAGLGKPTLAGLEELRARVALNAGDLATAKLWVDRALRDSGGATSEKVSLLQVAIRGDAAIIAQQRKDAETARQYLAFTGAGHLKSVEWIPAYDGDLPVCGTDGDVRPEDSAVVQMAIDPDGHVLGASPIYASRPGGIGLAFARAVMTWRWHASAVAKVDPFWLTGLRLGLRCDSRPDPESLAKPIVEAAQPWLQAHGAVPPEALARLTGLITEDGASAKSVSQSESAPLQKVDGRILAGQDVPAEVQALVIAGRAVQAAKGDTHVGAARSRAASLAAQVPAFAARYPASIATPWLTLEWAIALENAREFGAARPLLERVMATSPAVLPEDAPIRQVATLHLAIVRRQKGDAVGADTLIHGAGLDAAQCSLVDTRPVPTNLSIVSSQFPVSALRWGFEGYVRVAYDIGADGRPTAVRSVVSYPPYVFDEGTEAAARGFRYATPTIDGKPVGCTGESQRVSYRLPGR